MNSNMIHKGNLAVIVFLFFIDISLSLSVTFIINPFATKDDIFYYVRVSHEAFPCVVRHFNLFQSFYFRLFVYIVKFLVSHFTNMPDERDLTLRGTEVFVIE